MVLYLNEIVLRALSATALAFSISAVSKWNAIYLSHTRELSGDCSVSLSKSSATPGSISPTN